MTNISKCILNFLIFLSPLHFMSSPAGAENILVSEPKNLVEFKGKIYFSYDDGVHGRELWVIHESAAVPTLFKDIRPGPAGSAPDLLTAAGNYLFFNADDGSGARVWKSDGTPSGTAPFFDWQAINMTCVNNRLYALSDHQSWSTYTKTDGTTQGTSRTSIYADQRIIGTGSGIFYLDSISYTWKYPIMVYTILYFLEPVGGGRRLTDDISYYYENQNSRYGWNGAWTVMGGNLFVLREYFSNVSGQPSGITTVDSISGANGASQRIKTINLTGGAYPEIAGASKTVYFTVQGNLWKCSNGSGSAIRLASNTARHLSCYGDKVFFIGEDSEHGQQPWSSDGTASGTRMLAEVHFQDANFFKTHHRVPVGNKLFFSMGGQLWITDGTPTWTIELLQLENNFISEMVRCGGLIFFVCRSTNNEWTLWRSNGTVTGTYPLSRNSARLWRAYQ